MPVSVPTGLSPPRQYSSRRAAPDDGSGAGSHTAPGGPGEFHRHQPPRRHHVPGHRAGEIDVPVCLPDRVVPHHGRGGPGLRGHGDGRNQPCLPGHEGSRHLQRVFQRPVGGNGGTGGCGSGLPQGAGRRDRRPGRGPRGHLEAQAGSCHPGPGGNLEHGPEPPPAGNLPVGP